MIEKTLLKQMIIVILHFFGGQKCGFWIKTFPSLKNAGLLQKV